MVIWKIRKHLKPKTNSQNLKLIEIQGFAIDNNQLEQIWLSHDSCIRKNMFHVRQTAQLAVMLKSFTRR